MQVGHTLFLCMPAVSRALLEVTLSLALKQGLQPLPMPPETSRALSGTQEQAELKRWPLAAPFQGSLPPLIHCWLAGSWGPLLYLPILCKRRVS